MTLDELRQYDLGLWFHDKFKGTKIPTLEEFLSLCETADIEIMNIEIKPPLDGNMEIVQKTIDAVKAHGLFDKLLISSFSPEVLVECKKIDAECKTGFLYSPDRKIFYQKMIFGYVDIDMVAGPSEILVVADETADPKYLAADLMSQAEHDMIASAILITTSEEIADKTIAEVERQMEYLSRKEIIRNSIDNYGAVIITESIYDAIDLANGLAPEHLEMQVANPMEYLGRLDNAGSIFLGKYAPEPLGDYYAGPNHVLPTSGTARFFSPLSVNSFTKRSSFIYYTEQALLEAKDDIVCIAEREGLTAHANAIKVRFE